MSAETAPAIRSSGERRSRGMFIAVAVIAAVVAPLAARQVDDSLRASYVGALPH